MTDSADRQLPAGKFTWDSIFKNGRGIAWAALLVLLSRLPFLSMGYGRDPDAWRVANTARKIALGGQYSYSRQPGYPVLELFYAPIWNWGPFCFNLVTALFSVAAFVFFTLYLREIKFKMPILLGLAFVSVPVVYINSVCTMDYVWAIAFIMGGLFFVQQGRPALAGILLGLAIGCRITSGAMLLPLGLLALAAGDPARRLRDVAWLAAGALGVGALCFSPVVWRYGMGFLTYYDKGRPALGQILELGTVQVWGTVGIAALVLALISLALARRGATGELVAAARHPLTVAGWAAAVVIYHAAFFKLPTEPGYLIPVIPFVLLLLGRYLHRFALAGLCLGLMLSPWLETSWPPRGVKRGQLFVTQQGRQYNYQKSLRLAGLADRLHSKSLVLVGSYLPYVECILGGTRRGDTLYDYSLPGERLRQYAAQGYALYHNADARYLEKLKHNVDLEQFHSTLVRDDEAPR